MCFLVDYLCGFFRVLGEGREEGGLALPVHWTFVVIYFQLVQGKNRFKGFDGREKNPIKKLMNMRHKILWQMEKELSCNTFPFDLASRYVTHSYSRQTFTESQTYSITKVFVQFQLCFLWTTLGLSGVFLIIKLIITFSVFRMKRFRKLSSHRWTKATFCLTAPVNYFSHGFFFFFFFNSK